MITPQHQTILNYVTPLIASSSNREFIQHAQNTMQWAGIIASAAEFATVASMPKDGNLLVAAFTHEIERTIPPALHPKDFASYALYKQQSHLRSAELMADIMQKLNTPQDIANSIITMIRDAQSTDDCDANTLILREADVLSYFAFSLPQFFVMRLSDEGLKEICVWEIQKLTVRGRKYLAKLKFNDLRLKYCVNELLSLE
jgi:hypothetical protein